jgi:hypothetical protein
MASEPSDGAVCLIEAYFAVWLRGCDLGRRSVEALGLEAAMAGLWESLNAGFIKLESDADGFIGIALCIPPRPPAKPLARPAVRGWADA